MLKQFKKSLLSNYLIIYKRSIFTSKYYELKPQEVQNFLRQNNVDFQIKSSGIMVKECPACPKPTQNRPDNMYTLGIEPESGVFNCFRCHSKGNWYEFKSILSKIDYDDQFESNTDLYHQEQQGTSNTKNDQFIDIQNKLAIWRDNLIQSDNKEYEQKDCIDQIVNTRKINFETLKTFGIGLDNIKQQANDEQLSVKSIIFPYYFAHKKDKLISFDVNRVKFRGLMAEDKQQSQIQPSGISNSVFGLNTLNLDISQKYNDKNCVCITEGEFDSMSVWQELKIPSVSLPQGSSSLPLYLIKYLENYERIYLWMDFDESGLMNAEHFINKLGKSRTYFVEKRLEGVKDANDALKLKPGLIKTQIDTSKTTLDKSILNLADMKDTVYDLFVNHNELRGVASKDFRWFNRTLKGLRKGEMTIWTGSTGTGKTTMLSQQALDFSKSSVNTLFCSFEVKYHKVVQKMMLQHSRSNVKKLMQQKYFNLVQKDMDQKANVQFTSFQGGTPINLVSEIIDQAVQAQDIGHVIIDNLQFMMSDQGASVFSKLDMQDETISKLRKLVTDKDIHLSLVIHPRKNDGPDLSIHSVFGTAKSIQESDNIIIIQSKPKYRYIDVRKNRYDGTTGRAALGFNNDNQRFFELTNEEVRYLNLDEGKIKEVIKKRAKEMEEIELTGGLDDDLLTEGGNQIEREMSQINKIEESIYIEENSGPFFKNDLQNVTNYQSQQAQDNNQNNNGGKNGGSNSYSDNNKKQNNEKDLNMEIGLTESDLNVTKGKEWWKVKEELKAKSTDNYNDYENFDITKEQFGEEQTSKEPIQSYGQYPEVQDQLNKVIDEEINFDNLKADVKKDDDNKD